MRRNLVALNPAYGRALDQYFTVLKVNDQDPGLDALWDEVQVQAEIAEQRQGLTPAPSKQFRQKELAMWKTAATMVLGVVIGVVIGVALARADLPDPAGVQPKIVTTETLCLPSSVVPMNDRFDHVFGPEYPFVREATR